MSAYDLLVAPFAEYAFKRRALAGCIALSFGASPVGVFLTLRRMSLVGFVSAYNFARRLKTIKGLIPYEYICKTWTKEPERIILDPLQQMPGLST